MGVRESLAILLFFGAGCSPPVASAPNLGATAEPVVAQKATERGGASFYHSSLAGNLTASGEPYDEDQPTCAHQAHRFGTRLKVTDLKTAKSIVCRVNDRGPFVKGRIVDLSRSLAKALGILDRGVVEVAIETVDPLPGVGPLPRP